MKLDEVLRAQTIKFFSIKDLNKEELEQAIDNSGYHNVHLEDSRFWKMDDKNPGRAIYAVTYEDDGSFEEVSDWSDVPYADRKDQKLYIEIDPKSGKVCGEFPAMPGPLR